ncbi:PTS transporter subunit IIC, partial [Lacticaseibacillus rhamnosus]
MKFLVDMLSQPSIIAGIVVLVGLIALRKPFTEVIGGTVRAFIGFVVMLAGTNIIVGALNNFAKLFTKAFNMHGMIPSNEAAIGVTVAKYGTVATFIFVFGLVLNIVLARITKFKYIFLSSDHAFYMACCLTPIMILGGLNTVEAIVFGSMTLGVILCVFPAIAHPTMKIITGRDDMSFAHFGTLEYWLSAKIGSLVNKNKKSK